MSVFISLIFFISPIFAIPLSIFASIKDEKNRFIYLIELAIGLAFLAYCWKPNEVYDLYIWQQQATSLAKMSNTQFWNYAISNSEFISLAIKYIIGKSENLSLLQFVVVASGYMNIFYILNNSCKKFKISKSNYAITLIYVVGSLLYLNFISGLFFTWALTFFAVGVYLFYCKKNRLLSAIILVLSMLIHTSMIFPMIIFIMYILVKSKIDYKSFFIILFVSVVPNYPLPLLAKNTDIAFLKDLYIMYNGYFLSDAYNKMNSGGFFIVNILMSAPIYIICFFSKGKKIDVMGKLSILIDVISLILCMNAPIFIRYSYLSVLLFMPSFEKYFNSESESQIQVNNKKIIFYCLVVIEFIIILYQIYLLKDIEIMKLIINNIYKPIIQVFL